uniref:Uncharacterized protein n=1 Tax=Anguilla anguilla TaxID=7936 RepID=A0A0E9RSH3_ANGAN
MGVLGPSG